MQSAGTPSRSISSAVDYESSMPKRRRLAPGVDGSAHELGMMRDGSGALPASFVGSASGIHFIQSVYGAVGGSENVPAPPAHSLVPGEDDHLASLTRTIWQADELSDRTDYSFDDLVSWCSTYFDFWHPAYPYLLAPAVLQSLERLATGHALDMWEMVIVKSIMSISLADGRQNGTLHAIPKRLIFESFDESLESIHPAVMKPATLPSLQAVFAVQLFLVSMLRLNAASRLGGLLVRMAHQLGLHRCPTRFPGFSDEEQSQRRRLFECIYCLERHISHALGLPLSIRDDDVDVCHFDAELHSRQLVDMDSRLALLTFLSKMAGIRGSIMELRNKNINHRDSTSDTPVLLNTRLQRWGNEVDDFLEQIGDDETISCLHRAVLDILRHESIIILNRPLLALPKVDTKYDAGLESCIAASKSIITTLWRLFQLPKGTCPLIWPSFTWATWMSSFIIIYGAIGGRISHDVAMRAIIRAKTILQALALRGSVWPSACAVAIENLQNALETQSAATDALIKNLGLAKPSTSAAPPDTLSQHSHTYSSFSRSAPSPDVIQNAPRVPEPYAVALERPGMSSRQRSHGDSATRGHHRDAPQPHTPSNASSIPQHVAPQESGLSPLPRAWPETGIIPKDIPPYSFDFNDPLQGFDIPFWVGQDNYVSWTENL